MTTFRQLAKYDWVIPFKGSKLHAVKFAASSMLVDYEDWDEQTELTLACGRKTTAMIPGMFTRMGAPRCKQCCAAMKYPQGTGSPKNDDACRLILGLPVKGTMT